MKIYGIKRINGFGNSFFQSPALETRRILRFQVKSLPFSDDYAVLGLTPFATKNDVKHAYKQLALKYHPDVIRGETGGGKQETFMEIKSAYESLVGKLEEQEEYNEMDASYDEYDEWDEWMGFEGGMPVVYSPS